MNKKPLQVYLDSSDYSNFASGMCEDIYKKLLNYVEVGYIEVRYSFVTICEFLHTEKEYQSYAVRRAEVINNLCKSKVLKVFNEIFEGDCYQYLINNKSSKSEMNYAFDDHDRWFPSLAHTFASFKQEVVGMILVNLNKKIKSITDRNARFLIEKEVSRYIKNDSLTELGLSAINGFDSCLLDNLPIVDPEGFRGLLYTFMKGEISLDLFLNKLGFLFLNPITLAAWTVDNMEKSIESFQWLRSSGADFNQKTQEQRQDFCKIQEIEKRNGLSAIGTLNKLQQFQIMDHQRIRADFLNKINLQMCKVLEQKKYSGARSDWFDLIIKSPRGSIPSLDFWIESYEAYVKLNLIDDNRSLKPSDYGDIHHSVYIPYVDIFKTDRYMSPIYKPIAERCNTSVVSSLDELLEAITLRL